MMRSAHEHALLFCKQPFQELDENRRAGFPVRELRKRPAVE
jgi:hypothetical protein